MHEDPSASTISRAQEKQVGLESTSDAGAAEISYLKRRFHAKEVKDSSELELTFIPTDPDWVGLKVEAAVLAMLIFSPSMSKH